MPHIGFGPFVSQAIDLPIWIIAEARETCIGKLTDTISYSVNAIGLI